MANYNEEDNHRLGRGDEQKHNQPQQRYGYRAPRDQKWDEGNYFHTGPARRGAQDREQQSRTANTPRNQSNYNRGEGAHLNDHYGSRPNSAYRNERSYLDHGDSFTSGAYTPRQAGGAQPGIYNEPPASRYEQYNDVPGGRSRYKETDYRYGSGTHNWYQEGRYTPDSTPEPQRDNRGFFSRIKDTWNDIMHSDDPDYRPQYSHPTSQDRIDERKRYGNELYNRQQFDRGYEGGPRWADETDSGKDNFYDDTDRTQRYRR
ncbi:hypothetical protein WG947_12475 [Pontibacter sp. H259]|uniref:hypothetical protein n=1 Tax=Pontibacter sp. H259 TaxID=3133421 RepID=UPI0030C5D1AB